MCVAIQWSAGVQNCIAIQFFLGSSVLQYTALYCGCMGNRFVLQYKLYCEPRLGLCRDTPRAGRARGAQAWALGLAGVGAQARRRHGPWGAGRHERRRVGRWSARVRGSRRDKRMRGRAGAAGCAATRQPCAVTRPGGLGHDTARPPRTRPRARGLCAQAGPAGPVLVLVHLAWFSTWFLTRYFS